MLQKWVLCGIKECNVHIFLFCVIKQYDSYVSFDLVELKIAISIFLLLCGIKKKDSYVSFDLAELKNAISIFLLFCGIKEYDGYVSFDFAELKNVMNTCSSFGRVGLNTPN